MRKSDNGFEAAIVGLFLIAYFGVFVPPSDYFRPGIPGLGTDAFSQWLHVALGLFLIGALYVHRRGLIGTMTSSLMLWPMVAIGALSPLWSDVPEIAFRRSSVLLENTVFAIYLVHRFDLRQFTTLLTRVYVVIVIASFGVMIVAPELGYDHTLGHNTDWRGAMVQKNSLGAISVIGAITAGYSFIIGANNRVLAGTLTFANVFLLAMSNSATSGIVMLVCVGVAVVARLIQSLDIAWRFLGTSFAVVGTLACGFGYIFFDDLLVAIGRSPDLTGRTQLWAQVLMAFDQKPLLGHGLGFWQAETLTRDSIWAAIEFQARTAHNGWLDEAVQLGLVGISAFIMLWMVAGIRAFYVTVIARIDGSIYLLLILSYLFLTNFTESSVVSDGQFGWVIFVIYHLYSARAAAEGQHQHEPADGNEWRRPATAGPGTAPHGPEGWSASVRAPGHLDDAQSGWGVDDHADHRP